MRKLLIQLAILSILVLGSLALLLSRANGYTDPFYTRFTTPQQHNLIIGTSRAAQGIQPAILDSILHRKFYNYSFTIAHSPYGPTYLQSIKKKLKPEEKDGLFILTVDPWSISSTAEDPNDSMNFRELNLCLGNTSKVSQKPNFTYLIRNLKGNYRDILFPNKGMQLHDDGWFEITLDMDPDITSDRIQNRVEMYKNENLPYYRFSSLRFDYLKETIDFLNQHGKVYLVRLPLHKEMMLIDDQLIPDFNEKILQLAPLTNGYYDMTYLNNEFSYTDGNHLYKGSGKIVSEMIATWMLQNQKK